MEDEEISMVKIIDFGLVQKQSISNLQQSEQHCGTLIYQSPEQAIEHKYGKSADIWACGFTMYELLTGEHPIWYKGITKDEYLQKLENFNVETLFPHRLISPLAQSLITKLTKFKANQ